MQKPRLAVDQATRRTYTVTVYSHEMGENAGPVSMQGVNTAHSCEHG